MFSVNKKNARTLDNLIAFFESELAAVNDTTAIPLLLIDDEADNASVNTGKPGAADSRINSQIKSLLALFPRNSYLAYTATPFANILINPEDEEDLFPRNFIMTLGRPDNYIGPSKVFGTIDDDGKEDEVEVVDREVELDWFRNLDVAPYFADWEGFIPDPNKQASLESMDELPPSIRDAIYSFIIAISIRHLRGDAFEHKTMLIHATRLKAMQNRLRDLVNEFVDDVFAALTMPQLGYEDPHSLRMREIFELDFKNVEETWSSVSEKFYLVASLLKDNVYAINGDNKDVIDEKTYPNGLHSIRIGGDKLSRGLTLPGLMTSYFLRVSRMYDTLMQMGRWFGYRENYEDLCRIYTTAKLFNWFGHIANASESLRSRIIEMNNLKLTPREYGQRVQSHPGTMLVTALNKQQYTQEISLSFSGELVQLTGVDLSESGKFRQSKNAELISDLMRDLSSVSDFEDENGARVFKNVSPQQITKFIENFVHTEDAGLWNASRLISYITEMSKDGELVNWSVAFQTNTKPSPPSQPTSVGDFVMHSNVRQGTLTSSKVFTLNNRGLVSINHEKFDIDKDQRAALKSRKDIREKRDKKNGLLIIYWVTPSTDEGPDLPLFPSLAISFPTTENARTVRYVVGAGYEDFEEDFEEDRN